MRSLPNHSTTFAADHNDNIYIGYGIYSNDQYIASLVKTSKSGTTEWTKQLNGAILLDSKTGEDYIVVTGYFNYNFSVDNYSITGKSANTGFAAKLDFNGNLQWVKFIEGANSAISNVVINHSGEIVIQGNTTGMSSFHGYNFDHGIFFCVIKSNGTIVSEFQIKSNGHSWSSVRLSTDEHDNIYYSDIFKDSVLVIDTAKIFTQDSYYGSIYVAKLSKYGKIKWVSQFGGGRWEVADLVAYNGGEVYFIKQAPYEESYLTKLNGNGMQKWIKQVGAHLYPEVKNLIINSDGDLVVAGTTWMTANFGSCSFTGTGHVPFVAKIDTSAECRWLIHAQGTWSLYADQVIAVSDGFLLRGRHFSDGDDSALFGNHILYDDFFIAKVSESALMIPENKNADVVLYPNPSSGKIFLDMNGLLDSETKIIEVRNVLGERVFCAETFKDEFDVDLMDFDNGLYTLYLKSGEKRMARKIVLAR